MERKVLSSVLSMFIGPRILETSSCWCWWGSISAQGRGEARWPAPVTCCRDCYPYSEPDLKAIWRKTMEATTAGHARRAGSWVGQQLAAQLGS